MSHVKIRRSLRLVRRAAHTDVNSGRLKAVTVICDANTKEVVGVAKDRDAAVRFTGKTERALELFDFSLEV